MTNRAALYLRSSKDRSDVSIDAQRRALQELATARGLVVVAEFADAVESGKDDDRPGFQDLLRALKTPARGWDQVLVLDTSRIARRRHLALLFEHEAKRARVAVVYKNVPDTDPITEMLLKSILQAMDEWHSLTSRAKGLAGMAENVRQGWRAGGRAPRGYELEYHPTGAVREGTPVLKSKLRPNAEAPAVQAYLRARAAGQPRGRVIAAQGIVWSAGGLNDMEWLALTYAGHTVWNVTAERVDDAYEGGAKRRPRAEWVVKHDTHPALITTAEAEAILDQLERRRAVRTRSTDRPYLLTGFLVSSDGQAWSGEWDRKMNAANYRLGKGRRISARRVDQAVLDHLMADLLSDESVAHVLRAMQALVDEPVDGRRLATLEGRITAITGKVGKLVELITEAGEHERAAYRRSIATLEAEREGLLAELAKLRRQSSAQQSARQYTAADARRLLRLLADNLQAPEANDLDEKKAALGGFLSKIVLDPSDDQFHVYYRIAAGAGYTGGNLATLRGFEASPVASDSVVTWSATGRILAAKNRR